VGLRGDDTLHVGGPTKPAMRKIMLNTINKSKAKLYKYGTGTLH
jgi:hypothetical protein